MRLQLHILKALSLTAALIVPFSDTLCTMAQAREQSVALQQMRLSLNARNKPVEKVLATIKDQTGLNIHYDRTKVNADRLVSMNMKNAPVDSVFSSLSDQTGLLFSIVNDKVIVRAKQQVVNDITGIVRDKSGAPLTGVTVQVKGMSRGIQTDVKGHYSISAAPGDVLIFSMIGFLKKEVTVTSNNDISITLEEDTKQLQEVMVTALGIKKEDRRVAYSITKVAGEEVQIAREPTFVNALAGKVAGVVVQSPSTGPGGATRISIRGNSSFGNNQPLYVVDGVPINSAPRETVDDSGKEYGGNDPGDGLSFLNPDDIESINILKGATAGALYGSRAQNGVIMITTKKGLKGQGLGVDFNSNTVLETMVPYDDGQLQYVYGRGDNNKIFTAADNISNSGYDTGLSWGEKFAGQTFLDIDGKTKPYVPVKVKDQFKNFFSTGLTTTNSLALSKGYESGTYRLSLSQTKNNSSYPGEAGLERYNVTFRNTADIGKRLHTDIKVDLSRTKRTGIPLLRGDDRGSFSKFFTRTANTTDIRLLDQKDSSGNFLYTYTNPYLGIEKTKYDESQDRVLTSFNITYDITDHLHAQVLAGLDKANVSTLFAVYPNNKSDNSGLLRQNENKIEEDNIMAMLSYDKKAGKFSVDAHAGVNYRHATTSALQITGRDFVDPTLLDFKNTTVAGSDILSPDTRKEVYSVFGSAQFGYDNYLFLEVTGRNDWYSALSSIRPGASDNSLFYPSVNLSYVFTDAFDMHSNILSYGKVRASWAQVGSDPAPHLTDLAFAIQPTVNGLPGAQINNTTLPPQGIKPEITTEKELGAELKFFNNRLGLDVAVYDKKTKDFLLSSTVSRSTGFTSVYLNAGSMQNKGIEILLTGTPLETKDFSWDVSVNAAKNKNKVLTLTPELADNGVVFYDKIKAKVGYAIGSIFGTALRKGPNGEDVYKGVDTNSDGIPDVVVQDRGQVTYDKSGKPVSDGGGAAIVNNDVYLGNANPDWTAGLTNTFHYKNFSLSFLIDGQFGGQIFEDGYRWASFFGNTKATLQGRDGSYTPKGLIGATDGNGVITFAPNTLPYSPYQQYNAGGTLAYYADQYSVFSKTFIKLREVKLGYSLPASVIGKTPFKSATFTLIGRNLLFLKKNTPIFDPQGSDSVGNGFGFDSGSLPTSRTYGFNLNVRF
ncbi:SusC/RagA family TonB-linked outer membrane protein [Chitinophaga agrisoli]|uniref:SusC/RagA family TonB-linked outer membrane protein n=1 Tax=Chitinophaga agrisoli TaxID=2607653 RepID=A0A5B2W1A1_9BACT|nr:SusC/RagA family TonB-linked outer membrane protein [Chitinophaga agrisoli]KAA2244550.1 SusC/RagA family TonB-linked outer membrane protein [Chitinophaga agrisoli]